MITSKDSSSLEYENFSNSEVKQLKEGYKCLNNYISIIYLTSFLAKIEVAISGINSNHESDISNLSEIFIAESTVDLLQEGTLIAKYNRYII